MAVNEKYNFHRSRVLPVPSGKASGSAIMVGSLVGVLLTSEGDGFNDPLYATVALDGAWHLPVSTATALTVGAPVYYITSSGVLTTTSNSGANPLFGYALEPKGTTANQVIAIELTQV